jgi:ribonuclease HI
MEIGQYQVEFIPRGAIKSQVLAYFNAERIDSGHRGDEGLSDHWVMYFDDSYTLKGIGASIVLILLEGDFLKFAIQLDFPGTKSVAEYEGTVRGLCLAKDLGICRFIIVGDSQLVTKQIQKEYAYNDNKMAKYLEEVWKMEKFFNGFKVRYVPMLDSRDTSHLAWVASSLALTPQEVIIERFIKPSVTVKWQEANSVHQDLMVVDRDDQQPDATDWM